MEFNEYTQRVYTIAETLPITSTFVSPGLMRRPELWEQGIEGLSSLKDSDLISKIKQHAADKVDSFPSYGIEGTDLDLVSGWSIPPYLDQPGKVRSAIREPLLELDLISFWIEPPYE